MLLQKKLKEKRKERGILNFYKWDMGKFYEIEINNCFKIMVWYCYLDNVNYGQIIQYIKVVLNQKSY